MEFEKRFVKVFAEIMSLHHVPADGSSEEPWNSLAHMNLVVALEDEFNIEFAPDRIAEMVTFEKAKQITRHALMEGEVSDVTA